jgi:biopolymer transport protein ExbD
MAGTTSGGRSRGGTISAINVTPLVDVCLVLLIILMVSSTYIVSQTLKVQLPKSQSSDGQAEKPSTLTLLRNGSLRWNDSEVSKAEAESKLRAAYNLDHEMNLVISADKEVQHGRVVEVLDLAKIVGVTKFAINVSTE